MPALDLLRCPVCRGDVDAGDDAGGGRGDTVSCRSCGWSAPFDGRVVDVHGHTATAERSDASFDHKHDHVEGHNHHPVVWRLCYEEQVGAIEAAIGADDVVLDIGCGPAAPYRRPATATLVGVDPSAHSLADNHDIDLGLATGAARLPAADDSVDVVVALYAFHHMVADTMAASAAMVEAAFDEIARVVRPGGRVIVGEICPWRPTWVAERVGWRVARRLLPGFVDFVFWPEDRLLGLGAHAFPGAEVTTSRPEVGWGEILPPIIGRPGVKVPRFAYPFDAVVLDWRLAG